MIPELNMDEINYSNVFEATANLLNQPFLADIQFLLDDKVMHAHSHELSKRSSVFAEQFKGTIGTMKLIPIPNYPYGIFYEFLRFIYTDACVITSENALKLLKLSLEYGIIILTISVRDYLLQHLAITNVLEFYEFCLIENYMTPMAQLSSFISENFFVVLTQNRSFIKINKQTLIKLLQFDEIDCVTSEPDVYNATLKWVKNYCIKNSLPSNGKSKRELLIDVLKFIRFPVMTSEEFSKLVEKEKELLTVEEINSIFLSISLRQTVNLHGFSTVPRRVGVNYSLGADLKLNMKPYIGFEKRTPVTSCVKSCFTVTNTIVLSGIEIGVSIPLQNIRVDMLNVSRQMLRTVQLDISSRPQTWNDGFVLAVFSLPFVLRPKNTYYLEINYASPMTVVNCLPNRRPPMAYAVNKNCVIKFTEISPFLVQMNFKVIK